MPNLQGPPHSTVNLSKCRTLLEEGLPWLTIASGKQEQLAEIQLQIDTSRYCTMVGAVKVVRKWGRFEAQTSGKEATRFEEAVLCRMEDTMRGK